MRIAFALISWILSLYEFVIIARCIMSFLVRGTYSRLYEVLCNLTEPVLMPLRKLLDKTPLGNLRVDFSPMAAILLIGVITRCLQRVVYLTSYPW